MANMPANVFTRDNMLNGTHMRQYISALININTHFFIDKITVHTTYIYSQTRGLSCEISHT